MTDFHFIRHLPPHPDAYLRAYGVGEVPVVTTHSLVVDRISHLSQDLPRGASWHVSPTPRTRLTADLILAANPKLKPAARIEDEGFLEQKFGVFIDRLHSELRADPDFIKYAADPHNVAPVGGESLSQTYARVGARLDNLMGQDGPHVIVAHGGTLGGALHWGHEFADDHMRERMALYMGGGQLGKQKLTPMAHIFMRLVDHGTGPKLVSFNVTGGPEFRTRESLAEPAAIPPSLTP